jgi:ribosomal protein L28
MKNPLQPIHFRSLQTKARSQIPIKRKTWTPPAYPHIPSGIPSFAAKPHYTYKLRNKILAGGKTIHFGNNVSEFKNRTRRIWRPNIKTKALWSEALGRRVRLRLVTSVLRTIDKVGGLDAYLTGSTRLRMKELGPRGWEIRAAVIKVLRRQERAKYVRLFQRSLLLCPSLRMDSTWKEIRPAVRHTEGYAVLPEEYCKKAFKTLMERLREGRPVVRRRNPRPKTIFLNQARSEAFARNVISRNSGAMEARTARRAQKLNPFMTVPPALPKGSSVESPSIAITTQGQQAAKKVVPRRVRQEMRAAKRKLKSQRKKERLAKVEKANIEARKKRKWLLS